MSSLAKSASAAAPAGGSFLIETPEPAAVFTPEDFSEQHRQTMATANRFMAEEVVPVIAEYEKKPEGLSRKLLEKAGELGLLSVLVPEKYDGLEMDLTSQLTVVESIGRYASFSVTYGAHTGIGALPLVLFGNDEQKSRYLPKLVTAGMMAAYCLSEPQAGSDALAARTKAVLSEDGKHYVLDGQKMWISNGGWADLYTVFAKVDGEKFTAFLVERAFEGVKPGAEEHKMGIHGSSTTALYLDGVRVPVENVLGEVGRGHIIAFNILNLGRLKLGASCVGGAKDALAESIRYAKQRKAFGQAIAEFGAIRQKLADMAIRTYVSESIVYRTGGMIDARLTDPVRDPGEAAKAKLQAVEEYAAECAIVKVVGSEALDFVADEGVQIHGGYGYHQDYPIERAYRDSRINRIFEGTNEINRLLTVGMLLKRAAQGRLQLMGAVMAAAQGDAPEVSADGPLAAETRLVARAKTATLLAAGAAYQRHGAKLEHEQEAAYAVAEMILLVYSMDSVVLRSRKLAEGGRGGTGVAAAMAKVFVRDGLKRIEACAETVFGSCVEAAELDGACQKLRRLVRTAPIDTIALRRQIAERLIEAEKYAV